MIPPLPPSLQQSLLASVLPQYPSRRGPLVPHPRLTALPMSILTSPPIQTQTFTTRLQNPSVPWHVRGIPSHTKPQAPPTWHQPPPPPPPPLLPLLITRTPPPPPCVPCRIPSTHQQPRGVSRKPHCTPNHQPRTSVTRSPKRKQLSSCRPPPRASWNVARRPSAKAAAKTPNSPKRSVASCAGCATERARNDAACDACSKRRCWRRRSRICRSRIGDWWRRRRNIKRRFRGWSG